MHPRPARTRPTRRWLAAIPLAAALLAGAPPALAQQAGQPKVIELDELVIEGKVSKPQVFYVLGRRTLRYEGLKLQRSFVERIVQNARQNPF